MQKNKNLNYSACSTININKNKFSFDRQRYLIYIMTFVVSIEQFRQIYICCNANVNVDLCRVPRNIFINFFFSNFLMAKRFKLMNFCV